MTTTAFDDELHAVLANRWEYEARRVDQVLAAMTKRERALVREVAVMAGVRATMRAGSRDRVPPDSEVLRDAISSALGMPDLYPTIARIERAVARRAARARTTPPEPQP